MDRIDIKLEEVYGYGVAKHLESDDERFYCSLGGESCIPWEQQQAGRRPKKVGIISDDETGVYMVGGDEFYAEIRACKTVEQVRKVFMKRLAAEFAKSPAMLYKMLTNARALGAAEGRRQAQYEVRKAIGLEYE